VIVAGDFNSEPDSPVMAYLAEHFHVAPKQAPTLTFPADEPVKEIDFICYRPADELEIVESRVIDETMASDHRPVWLELAHRPSPA
jgi:endonuclease/exonuclease/phosphatase family metal-dependent hydrolase